jgi:predicted DsbA family dithiol-disulfide isomerase
VKIEIWSDVVCPWCYIGKRRLEHALDEFEAEFPGARDDVEILWRSFQLNPDAPRHAVPTKQYLASRFGPQAGEMSARVAAVAKAEGLDFDSDHALSVNTFDAHRLLHLAQDEGVQDAAKERLLRAHFIEGADLSDPDTLVALMKEAGVSEDRARAVIENPDEYAKDVEADIEEARALGAGGVPFFVLDRKYGVSGAQPVETFLQALRTAHG